MPYFEIFWNFEDEDGNVAHIAEHEEIDAITLYPVTAFEVED